jgi:hypothetical protein
LALEPFAFDLDNEIYPLFTQQVGGEGLSQAVGLVNLRG